MSECCRETKVGQIRFDIWTNLFGNLDKYFDCEAAGVQRKRSKCQNVVVKVGLCRCIGLHDMADELCKCFDFQGTPSFYS